MGVARSGYKISNSPPKQKRKEVAWNYQLALKKNHQLKNGPYLQVASWRNFSLKSLALAYYFTFSCLENRFCPNFCDQTGCHRPRLARLSMGWEASTWFNRARSTDWTPKLSRASRAHWEVTTSMVWTRDTNIREQMCKTEFVCQTNWKKAYGTTKNSLV